MSKLFRSFVGENPAADLTEDAATFAMVDENGDNAHATMGELKAELSAQFAPLPAVVGTAGQVLAIDTADPLVTEWVTGGGGGGGGALIVQEGDVTVAAAASTLDFGNGFDVTESPANEANVALDLGEYTGTDLPVASGGTGASDASTALTNLGVSAFAKTLLDDADNTAARTTLGLGTAATTAATAYATAAQGTKADAALPLIAAGAAVENIGAVEWNVNVVAASGSTETLDTSLYGVHKVTMDQSCTFTFSNPAPSTKETEFKLYLLGAFTPTFPAAVKWADATPPTYTGTGSGTVYVFSTVDAGTTWYGSSVGKAFA
jgi:hypothetical protein